MSELLLIHGAGCNQALWPPKLKNNLEVNVRSLDLPGHGESSANPCSSLEDYVGKLASLIGDNPVICCGHSLGGAIALTLALQFPKKVKGLILMGTGARLRVDPLVLKLMKWKWLYPFILRKMVKTSCSKQASNAVKKSVYTMMKDTKPEIFYNDLLICDRFDVMEKVETNSTPTLILCGQEDRLTPLKYSSFLNQKIRRSQIEIFSGAGHMLPLEKPMEVAVKISGWIEKKSWANNSDSILDCLKYSAFRILQSLS